MIKQVTDFKKWSIIMAVPGFVGLTQPLLVHPRDFEDDFIAPCSLIDAGHSLNPQKSCEPHEPSAIRAWKSPIYYYYCADMILYLNKIHNPYIW